MARSRLSYAEAVRLLTGGGDTLTVLSRSVGGAMLLAAPFVPGVLSWFDAKGEANTLLRDLVGGAPNRIRASRGRAHYELIEAAHDVLVVSAFFDALAEQFGARYAALELTDEERRRIGAGEPNGLREHFERVCAPLPGALIGFRENLPSVEQALARMAGALDDFVGGLAAGEGFSSSREAVPRALQIYEDGYVRLAAEVPEFGIWSQLSEHAATRADVRAQSETLTELAGLLEKVVRAPTPADDAVRNLARHYAHGLTRLLWRSDAPAPAGLRFPTVEKGFVSPRFRLAVGDQKARLADESWWAEREVRADLAGFLAGVLADPESTQSPLLILGHPGAGKSLLTEVIAARLPTAAFTTVRVPLRRVDPDVPVHQQVEAAIEQVTKERITWGDLSRAADTTKVILLDGFDELVQATGVAQSRYVEQAAAFQQEEWISGRPVVVVITSRTLVMDRTVVRDGTIVLKLEPFDEDQVGRWCTAWNAVNAAQPDFRPLTPAELWQHEELAGQPLLLLMLGVYAAEAGGGGLDADDFSTDQLYRRLLNSFIRRQVREKSKTDLGDRRYEELEADSRRDLAAVAFGMFCRRRQWVGEDDLESDLKALHPGDPREPAGPGEPVSRARQTVAAFFFVHVAQTDDATRRPGRRSYEFLHATFAEYLVAEHTLQILGEVADDWHRSRRRSYGANLNDGVLRDLLSHQPLTNGEQIVPFLVPMIHALADDERARLREVAVQLFRTGRRRIQDSDYRPTPFDVVNRTAAYTANLALLAAVCGPDGVTVDELCGAPDSPHLESAVRLWRSGLDIEVQNSFFNRLRRTGSRLTLKVGNRSLPAELREAQLIGDSFVESVIDAGLASHLLDTEGSLDKVQISAFQATLHRRVVNVAFFRWPVPVLGRLSPGDEDLYRKLAEWLDATVGGEPLMASQAVLAKCLLQDGPHISVDLLDRLVRAVLLPRAGGRKRPAITVAMLALRQPDLLDRHPGLLDVVLKSDQPAFLFELARSCRDLAPEKLDPIMAELFGQAVERDSVMGEVTPSMIGSFRSSPRMTLQILDGIDAKGVLGWSQVRPRELRAAIEHSGSADSLSVMLVGNFVESRRDESFDEEDTAAYAWLRDLVDGQAA